MDLLRLSIDKNYTLSFDVSPWLLLAIVIVGVLLYTLFRMKWFSGWRPVEMEIALGKVGKVKLAPTTVDLQVAHRIWTELVTRKAAILIDPENDVIVEVYNSWYALFTKVRELIGNLPADQIKKEKSTQEIVRISTETLNNGLRPHLTKWQARFRAWYRAHKDELKQKSPQELQKEFPQFNELVSDMLTINHQLIEYANELHKLTST